MKRKNSVLYCILSVALLLSPVLLGELYEYCNHVTVTTYNMYPRLIAMILSSFWIGFALSIHVLLIKKLESKALFWLPLIYFIACVLLTVVIVFCWLYTTQLNVAVIILTSSAVELFIANRSKT